MILYKYMSWPNEAAVFNGQPNYAKELIEKNELYLSRATEFNDPYDVGIYPVFKGTEKEIVQRIVEAMVLGTSVEHRESYKRSLLNSGIHYTKEQLDDISKMFLKWRHETTGIISFSELNNSMLMWAHYAGAHTGVCLVFDTEKDREKEDIFRVVYPVEYVDEYPEIDYVHEEGADFYRKIYATKFSAWRYEHECRVIYRCGEERKKCPFSAEALIGIICGCKMEEAEKKDVKQTINRHMAPIYLQYAKTKLRSFEIAIAEE